MSHQVSITASAETGSAGQLLTLDFDGETITAAFEADGKITLACRPASLPAYDAAAPSDEGVADIIDAGIHLDPPLDFSLVIIPNLTAAETAAAKAEEDRLAAETAAKEEADRAAAAAAKAEEDRLAAEAAAKAEADRLEAEKAEQDRIAAEQAAAEAEAARTKNEAGPVAVDTIVAQGAPTSPPSAPIPQGDPSNVVTLGQEHEDVVFVTLGANSTAFTPDRPEDEPEADPAPATSVVDRPTPIGVTPPFVAESLHAQMPGSVVVPDAEEEHVEMMSEDGALEALSAATGVSVEEIRAAVAGLKK